eukprot:jgi/Tetstr1/437496/TSEL_026175.t1
MDSLAQQKKMGYTLLGVSAACVGYIVFDQLSASEDETMQQAFRFAKMFWVMFVLLTVKRVVWEPAASGTAATKKPAKEKAKADDDDEEEEEEEVSAAARRRVRRVT